VRLELDFNDSLLAKLKDFKGVLDHGYSLFMLTTIEHATLKELFDLMQESIQRKEDYEKQKKKNMEDCCQVCKHKRGYHSLIQPYLCSKVDCPCEAWVE
jgi:hypothetical protein